MIDFFAIFKSVQARKARSCCHITKAGFTLVELAIVLVIIGLVVGGVLVGQDLIQAAMIRSQISQIEKYQVAVNSFKLKYGYLPGDIPDPTASAFGFVARGTNLGQGDGNGLIQGNCSYQGGSFCSPFVSPFSLSAIQASGENPMFWEDLSTAKLIEGNFSTASCCSSTMPAQGSISETSTPALKDYFPRAKLGESYFIRVGNGGPQYFSGLSLTQKNYFDLSYRPTTDQGSSEGRPKIPVRVAYNIDNKIDDGLPQSGNVLASVLYAPSATWPMIWVQNDNTATDAITASATTCYDNGGDSSGAIKTYSISQNGGNGLNCALSFKFQ